MTCAQQLLDLNPWQIFSFKALLERFANNLPVLLWEKMKELLGKPISSDVFVGVLVS